MVTYSLLVKGVEIHAYAQLALKMRGIMHVIVDVGTRPSETNFWITVPEDECNRTTTRLAEWFAADIHCKAPFPNGSLLTWSSTDSREDQTVYASEWY